LFLILFRYSFRKGDLHPGNVYVTRDGKKFVLFDVGIVNEYSDSDHQIIVDVLAAFIRKDGRRAGRLMIDDSNSKLRASNVIDCAKNEEEYIDKIEALTIRACTQGYLMEQLGSYISYICNAASLHHVMMNPAFISAALAVKVQEGIALAMDPSIQIPNIAIPIIIESESRRLMKSAKEANVQRIQSIQQFFEYMNIELKKLTTSSQPPK
jgi:predicted unusual protein kinase regulating ubiquinone biosynthesis (AarF/ABC1/UbiB family)